MSLGILSTVAAIAALVFFSGCSTAPESAPEAGAQGKAEPQGVAAFQNGTTPNLLLFDPVAGTISKPSLRLRRSDVVHVAVVGNGKIDLRTVGRARLAGAPAERWQRGLVFDDTDGSETVQFRDVNGDGYKDAVMAFSAGSMAPPSGANRFVVEIEGINAITIWDYERAWAGNYWPTFKSRHEVSDHVVTLDLASGEFYPSTLTLAKGDVIAFVVNDYTYSHGCDVDLSSASLWALPEVGDEFYESGNKAAGLMARKHMTHFMDYSDDRCFGPVFHFDTTPLFSTKGNEGNGLTFVLGKTTYEFFNKYRPQATGVISMSLGGTSK